MQKFNFKLKIITIFHNILLLIMICINKHNLTIKKYEIFQISIYGYILFG